MAATLFLILLPLLALAAKPQHSTTRKDESGSDLCEPQWVGLFQVGPTQLMMFEKVDGQYDYNNFRAMFLDLGTEIECNQAGLELLLPFVNSAYLRVCEEAPVVDQALAGHPIIATPFNSSCDTDCPGLIELQMDLAAHISLFPVRSSSSCLLVAASPTIPEFESGILFTADGSLIFPQAESHHDEDLTINKPWGPALLGTLITCIPTLVGILTLMPVIKYGLAHALSVVNAFAGGAYLSAVFTHMLPESILILSGTFDETAMMWRSGALLLGGWLAGAVLSGALRVTLGHTHSHAHSPADLVLEEQPTQQEAGLEKVVVTEVAVTDQPAPATRTANNGNVNAPKKRKWTASAVAVLVGDACHNFVDGVILGAAFNVCGTATGWALVVAVVAHELPSELADFVILVRSGFTLFQALLANLVSGLVALLGVVVVLSGEGITDRDTAYILLVGAGLFVYIAATDVLPSVIACESWRAGLANLFAFIFGAVVVALPLINHKECSGTGEHGHAH